jgi:SAM-dependent methyltransferase
LSLCSGNRGYAEAATVLVRQYEAVTFGQVHRDVLYLYPSRSCRVLDVGAGTGRDAAALSRAGHTVVAVEPTTELREHGQHVHGTERIQWVDDALPDLTLLRHQARLFDMVLLIAVWMHLDEHERIRSMRTLTSLMAGKGRMVMSLRHGPVPTQRRMFPVSAAETIDLAHRFGLRMIHHSQQADARNRPDVHWSFLGFESGETPALTPFSEDHRRVDVGTDNFQESSGFIRE